MLLGAEQVSSESAIPEVDDLIGDKYRVIRHLGSGGMGMVFEAEHQLTGKHFAIKWLPRNQDNEPVAQRLLREAQACGRIRHPNVVEVYDVGEDARSVFMVMELLEGETLERRLTREQRMSVAETCRILLPCMAGVAAAHRLGVIHRDLKPGNIFLHLPYGQPPEVPKVLDFGISKLANAEAQLEPRLTISGTIVGTPYYMAPEQLRGLPVTPSSDVYAFGVLLYELLSGQHPFEAETYADLVYRVITTEPVALRSLAPNVPGQLAEVAARALAREPAERFESVQALASALEALSGARPAPNVSAGGEGSHAPVSYTAPPAARRDPRALERTWLVRAAQPSTWGVLALVACAIALGVWIAMPRAQLEIEPPPLAASAADGGDVTADVPAPSAPEASAAPPAAPAAGPAADASPAPPQEQAVAPEPSVATPDVTPQTAADAAAATDRGPLRKRRWQRRFALQGAFKADKPATDTLLPESPALREAPTIRLNVDDFKPRVRAGD